MSKLPVRESGKSLSPRTEASLAVIQALFPIAASLATAIWAINGYFEEQEKNRQQQAAARDVRFAEARKPFYEMQLNTYQKAASVAGHLAAAPANTSEEFRADRNRFYELYWSELSMVEDDEVKDRMVKLEQALANYEADGSKRQQLQNRVYCLAVALKSSIASSWTVSFENNPPKTSTPAKTPNKSYCDRDELPLPAKGN